MVYLDNAATSFPKPESVYRAVSRAMRERGGNPSRGSHKMARLASEEIYNCREEAAKLFSCDEESVVLTFNATHALNLAIKGLAERNSHILLSDMEHNSVLRPVNALKRTHGCSFDIYSSHSGDADKIITEIASKIRKNTRMIIANHASNVCGVRLPIEKIGALCERLGIVFIVDASQSAGHIPLDFGDTKADALCMAGHKGLYGPQGTGLLILKKERPIATLLEGGSGVNSLDVERPEFLPERLETGTYSAPLAAGLAEGMRWVRTTGIHNISRHEKRLCVALDDRICDIRGVTLYCRDKIDVGAPVLFNVDGISPAEVSKKLDEVGICVRSGLHCSPVAHKALSTGENGAVRVSFGCFNTEKDASYLADQINKIVKGV